LFYFSISICFPIDALQWSAPVGFISVAMPGADFSPKNDQRSQDRKTAAIMWIAIETLLRV
jgi:hypothetical protein